MRILPSLPSRRHRFEWVAARHNRRYCGGRRHGLREADSAGGESTGAQRVDERKESSCP